MPDSKITALTSIGTSTDPVLDQMVIVDVSDGSMAATGTTKKVTLNNLLACSPTATLASATITGALTVGTGANAAVQKGSILGGYTVFENSAGTGNPSITFNNDIDTGLLSPAANTIAFAIGGSEAMRLNSTGLGVGGVPSYKLDVQGTSAGVLRLVNILNLSTDPAAVTRLSLDGQGATWHLDNERTNGIFKITRNSTACLTIDNSGNVGVGVTPSYKLDVSTGGVLTTTARLVGNDQSNVRLRFENTGASGRIWELVGGLAGSNNRWFSLRDVTGSTTPWGVDDSMNVISNVTGTAPTLSTNSQMVFNLTSNTNLRISVRGTDGTTRTANITLA
jgi:hypothetical protein